MTPERRRLLALASTAVLGGCVGTTDDAPGGTGTDTTTGALPETDAEPTPTAEPTTASPTTAESTTTPPPVTDLTTPELAVTAVDPSPFEGVEIDVTLTRQFTAEHPGELRITFANVGSEPREFSFGPSPPFPPYGGVHRRADALIGLHPKNARYLSDRPVPDSPVDGCWRPPRQYGGTDPAVSRTLDPGEEIEQTYMLLAGFERELCLPAGEYRFEKNDYAGSEATWGFTLTATAGESTPTPEPTTSEPVTELTTPELSVTAVDPSPFEGIEIDVTLTRQFTTGHPGELRITFANTGSEPREFTFLQTPPYPPDDGLHRRSDALVELHPQDERYDAPSWSSSTKRCWRRASGSGEVDTAVQRTLEPDEVIEGRYTLLSGPRQDPCLPAGDYRFEKDGYAGSDTTWGFTLTATERG